jgi:hypothetical protein
MNYAWLKWAGKIFVFLVLMWPLTGIAEEGSWKGFYGKEALDYTATQTAPDIRAMLEEDLPKFLTQEERRRLAGVHIAFPREDSSHPMNFYADSKSKTIVIPISSLRFLVDTLKSYAWLNANGYDLQPITDYLSIIKYQWPGNIRGVTHTPIETLGIPANATEDSRVSADFQQLLGTAIAFLLGHELGHIYHQHGSYKGLSPENAQRQERDADTFALNLMPRMNATPVGAAFFFHVVAHMEPLPGDDDFLKARANRTHPLNSERVRAIANDIQKNTNRLSIGAKNPQAAIAAGMSIASELKKTAQFLGDKDIQKAFRRIGLSSKLDTLRPRR